MKAELPIETVKPIEMHTHFAPYAANFPPVNSSYPPVFPPANITVPPPNVNSLNHIVPPGMHPHMGAPTAIRPGPTTPTQAFAAYSYPANASYFANSNAAPVVNNPRAPYYPPQP